MTPQDINGIERLEAWRQKSRARSYVITVTDDRLATLENNPKPPLHHVQLRYNADAFSAEDSSLSVAIERVFGMWAAHVWELSK